MTVVRLEWCLNSASKNEGPAHFAAEVKYVKHFDVDSTGNIILKQLKDDNHNLNDESGVTTADDKGNECDLRDSSEKQDGRSTRVFVPESEIRN